MKEYYTIDVAGLKRDRNLTDDLVQIKIIADLLLVEETADITAVSLVPAETVHVSGCFAHFLNEGSFKNIAFHFVYPFFRRQGGAYR